MNLVLLLRTDLRYCYFLPIYLFIFRPFESFFFVLYYYNIKKIMENSLKYLSKRDILFLP